MGKFSDFLELIPKKVIFILLLILLILILGSTGLDYLINYNKTKINEINNKVNNFVNEYYSTLQQENYISIIQFLAMDYLATNKKFLSKVIENLPKYLPKNFVIQEFSYDAKEDKVILSGYLPNWVEYAKYYKYFAQTPNIFPELKVENLDFDKNNSRVLISISFKLNYQEFYK